MGGYNPGMIKGDTYLEDVWSSEDGVTWTEATDSNVHFHFAQRVNYTFWRRDPGNQWSVDSEGSDFDGRYGYSRVIHNDRVWILWDPGKTSPMRMHG